MHTLKSTRIIQSEESRRSVSVCFVCVYFLYRSTESQIQYDCVCVCTGDGEQNLSNTIYFFCVFFYVCVQGMKISPILIYKHAEKGTNIETSKYRNIQVNTKWEWERERVKRKSNYDHHRGVGMCEIGGMEMMMI